MVVLTKEPDGATPKEYVDHNISPTLTPALKALCQARPRDPISWLANYLLEHKPSAAPVLEAGELDVLKVKDIFRQFDSDDDGALTMSELKRAFRAVGMSKREGPKAELDAETFRAMDTNGDGVVDLDEWSNNLRPDLRMLLLEKIDEGWTFDPYLWSMSQERHSKWDMGKVFRQFDTSKDGLLNMLELQRAFRALGLPRRDGAKLEVDMQMFRSFDTSGDGKISLDEFSDNMPDGVRAKIEEKLDAGWTFDAEKWSGRRGK